MRQLLHLMKRFFQDLFYHRKFWLNANSKR